VSDPNAIVRFTDVSKYFKGKGGEIVTALDAVNVAVGRDQVLALVGESGSGKTTLGRISVGLLSESKGQVLFEGKRVRDYKKNELWRMAQYIHQDPYSALDPYLNIRDFLDRPLRFLAGIADKKERLETISTFIRAIGMEDTPTTTKLARLSGGEKQRLLLARAFILEPRFVAADEPTTMVDFIHRNEILELLKKLRRDLKTSMMLITHDLSIASFMSDYVAIMFRGSIVEYGRREEVLGDQLHPYTQALFSLTPEKLAKGDVKVAEIVQRKRLDQSGAFAKGCKYAGRCPYVFDRCGLAHPTLEHTGGEHWVACYLDHSVRD
jgi:oligopeptide/dipeptide ABC transporter ATP-binding protein